MSAVGDARKRAAEAASNSESATLATNGPNLGDDTSETADGPQNATQRPTPVDPGAIGRLNDDVGAAWEFRESLGQRLMLAMTCTHDGDEFGPGAVCVTCFANVQSIGEVVERIVREHTDRALAEAWDEGFKVGREPIRSNSTWWLPTNPYRAARQEQGR